MPGFYHVPFNNIAAMERAIGEGTAAVLVDTVQGEGGVCVGKLAYCSALRRLCDERDAVDEV